MLLLVFKSIIIKKCSHLEADQDITWKLDPLCDYIRLIFDSPQPELILGLALIPHKKPCQVSS